MRYYDYDWDLEPTHMKLDKELDTNKLGWQPGDVFMLVEGDNQQKYLRKISALERFTRGIDNHA